MKLRSDNRGTSTLELLVATTFAAAVAAQTVAWTKTALAAVQQRARAASWERTAWLALDVLAGDVRNAGYHGGGSPMMAVAAGDRRSLILVSDIDGDGASDGANERVGFVFDTTNRVLRRSTGTAGAQELVEGLPGMDVEFHYVDGAGDPLTPTATGLTATQRAAVRRIDVVFHARDAASEPIRGSVHLRNSG